MFLHSKRLVLRNFEENDIDVFVAYRNEPEVAKFQGWGTPYSRSQAEKYVASVKDVNAPKQGGWLQVAIVLKENNELIGDIGCFIKPDDARQATIGFTLASKYWRKGYAYEAVRCWLGYLFDDIDIHRVTADCDTENDASFGLLEKLGFRREAHFIESYPVNGVYTSEYHYGLLQREWRTMIGRGNTC
jgi:aminoglycoside 6'-N-acetyltransferase